MKPIAAPYLICLNIPCYRDRHGRRYFDPLWHKDLVQHVRYLKNLTLACPVRAGDPPPGVIEWAAPLSGIRFVDLPAPDNIIQAILHLPLIAARLWSVIGHADIVHSGLAGWPIAIGWLSALFASMRGKRSVIIIESAPWRLRPGLPVTWRKRFRARLSERVTTWCANRADLFIATQVEYLALRTRKPAPDIGHVIHASWVDEGMVLSPEAAQQSWRSKRGLTLKLLFAGRLDRGKGLLILLRAMRLLSEQKVQVELDILGEGELLAECQQAARDLRGVTRIRVLGVIPYDQAFFERLGKYHALVVPSLSDEQPRIVYDAFSQAIPVLAGNTAGLRDCIEPGRTGVIVPTQEPESWSKLIQWCAGNSDALEAMGTSALEVARQLTHEEMHRRRWELLLRLRE